MNKRPWQSKKIAIQDLILWDNNPRTFDKNFPNPNEAEIISRYDSEELLRIGKNIVKYQEANLQPGELSVVKKDKEYVVFDGNRRISVYKILLNPNLVTNKKKAFEALSKLINFDNKKELLFSVAPDIESALERVGDLHTDNFHKNWNSLAQSNFATIGIDGTIKLLKGKKAHVKRTALYKKIKEFHFSPEVENIIFDPEQFNITSLERIVNSRIGKKYLNYSLNDKGGLVIEGSQVDFDKILKQVAEDIASGLADSRKQQLTEHKIIYFTDLLKRVGLTPPNNLNTKPRPSNVNNVENKIEDTKEQKNEPPFLLPISKAEFFDYSRTKIEEVIVFISNRFKVVARQLAKRRLGANPFVVENEYDVQDIFRVLLRMFFDNIIPEEPTPKTAGASARIDFLAGEVALELKMMRESLTEKKLADDIGADLVRYPKHGNCKALYFFVYDPNHMIDNSTQIIRDIESSIATSLKVKVIISE